MQKSIVAATCCALELVCCAGVRITGPVTVIDADGVRQYEHVEVHEIVGAIDCVEIIGRKSDGGCESRGYVDSSSARWVASSTNVVSRPYREFSEGKCDLPNLAGLSLRVSAVSDTNKVLVVGSSCVKKPDGKNAVDSDMADWRQLILVDKETGLGFSQSAGGEFDDGSNDMLLASLYANANGAVKIWYVVVDAAWKTKAKGWFSAVVENGKVLGKQETSVMRSDDLRIVFKPIECRAKTSRRHKAWLHFAVKRGQAEAYVGLVLHGTDSNAASLR